MYNHQEYIDNNKLKETVHNDWRLPTIVELLTLVNYNKFDPASDLEDTVLDGYWSSTSYEINASRAWIIIFRNGSHDYNTKSNDNYVRCVRAGGDGLEWSSSSENRMTWDEAVEYAENLIALVYYKG